VIRAVLLDSGPLGLVTQRRGVPAADACHQWADECLLAGAVILVPAIIDYEVRQELLRTRKSAGIARLDAFIHAEPDRWLPLTEAILRTAAELWARSRQQGVPSSDPKELDVDVILVAQALSLRIPPDDLVIATTNVGHLRAS
jgi:predicted nucleic acid-binding protein